MATSLLQIGIPTVMAQNVVFALPCRQCNILALPNAIQFSNDGVTFVAADIAASSTQGVFTSGAFVRCTNAAGTTVLCKAN